MTRTLTALTFWACAFVLTALVLAMAPSGQAAPAGVGTPAAAPGIVNGVPAGANANPYMVTLHTPAITAPGPQGQPFGSTTLSVQAERGDVGGGAVRAQFCGGTLTTPTTVVTAAHCVVSARGGTVTEPAAILIGFGPDLTAPGIRTVAVVKVTANPAYDRRSAANDIAVLTLAEPVTGVPTLVPLRPDEASTYLAPGAALQVLGWGNMLDGGRKFPSVLQVGNIVLFPYSSCGGGAPYVVNGVRFLGFGPGDVDPVSMLCAAGTTPAGLRVDSCRGDDGGPLVQGTAATARLVGIVSRSKGCAGVYPGVYTRVSAEYAFLATNGATPTRAPTTAPSITSKPASGE